MKAIGLLACACAITLFATSAVPQDAATASVKRPFQLIKVRHTSAVELAGSLSSLIGDADYIKIIPQPASNTLLVFGQQDDMPTIHELIEQLDLKPASVDLDVTIIQTSADAEADAKTVELAGDVETVTANLAALEKAGTVKVIERLHLTTLDNQRAQLQVDKNEAVTRGRSVSGGPARDGFPRRTQAVMVMESVGTMLTASPRISGDDVMAEIAVEKSWISKAEPAGDEESSVSADGTHKLSISATVTIPKNQAVYLGGQLFKDETEQPRIAVIVTAKTTP